MSGDRLLVIDADLPKRLAVDLKARCRDSIHVATLNLATNVKDPDLLRALSTLYSQQKQWVPLLVVGAECKGPTESLRFGEVP